MSQPPPVSRPTRSLPPADVEGFDCLAEPALDLRWLWHHCQSRLAGEVGRYVAEARRQGENSA